MSGLNSGTHESSLRDCFRLGKYKKDSQQSRPILAKFNRPTDVLTLLSLRASLPKGITCKPDLSRQERQAEAILLKERWKLIQSGIDRKDIKIRNGSLYAKGKLHCRVENDKLITVNETISLLPTTVDTSSTRKNTPSPTLQSHVDISSNDAPMQSVTPAVDNKSPS